MVSAPDELTSPLPDIVVLGPSLLAAAVLLELAALADPSASSMPVSSPPHAEANAMANVVVRTRMP
ncbi:MAG TPA: hypothetical protein VG755_09125 [Nannocystaceae bacterium]|nr:hypothetical protein [Nannocystaceae bacterium]